VIVIDERSTVAEFRAAVAECHSRGLALDHEIEVTAAVVEQLELPDDLLLLSAYDAACSASLDLNNPDSIAFARGLAIAAGRGMLGSGSGSG
jgi:hypothetical protein